MDEATLLRPTEAASFLAAASFLEEHAVRLVIRIEAQIGMTICDNLTVFIFECIIEKSFARQMRARMPTRLSAYDRLC
jgi:hypothetical protein